MTDPTPLDITNMSELTRITEEVAATKKPRQLTRDNKPIAVITPVTPKGKTAMQDRGTTSDPEAFKKAAGTLKGLIDADQLKKDIYESRQLLTRPQIRL